MLTIAGRPAMSAVVMKSKIFNGSRKKTNYPFCGTIYFRIAKKDESSPMDSPSSTIRIKIDKGIFEKSRRPFDSSIKDDA